MIFPRGFAPRTPLYALSLRSFAVPAWRLSVHEMGGVLCRVESAAVSRRQIFVHLVALEYASLRLFEHALRRVWMRLRQGLEADLVIAVFLERNARTR